tara:strand:- start:175 stop:300 length:126 start_codon:yes stop_codon:yes gene_type:complete
LQVESDALVQDKPDSQPVIALQLLVEVSVPVEVELPGEQAV